MVRVLNVLVELPLILKLAPEAMDVAPAPLMVPPDQLYVLLIVRPPEPLWVPDVCVKMVSELMVAPALVPVAVSVPPSSKTVPVPVNVVPSPIDAVLLLNSSCEPLAIVKVAPSWVPPRSRLRLPP